MDPNAQRIAAADLDEEGGSLEITWKDGHRSSYPLPYLRGECPCANCRTERDEGKRNPLRVVAPAAGATEIGGIEPVGRYGMRLTWRDGHQAGIYTFQYLREICPCEACREQRREDGTPFVHGIYIPQ